MDNFGAGHPLHRMMERMTDPVRTIAERVRTRVLRDGVDLARDDVGRGDGYAREEVRRYSERALAGAHARLGDEHGTARDVVASLTGYRALQPFFDDPEVEEIWINAPTRVFVARDGVAELTTVVLSDREVRELVERMLQHSGRRVDLSLAVRRRVTSRRLATARRDPRRHASALVGQHPQVPAAHPLARRHSSSSARSRRRPPSSCA